MGYYVYKYVTNGEVKYIGKTTNLEARIHQHTKDKLHKFHGEIYFFECANQTEMNSWEFILIQKYHPVYNVVFNDTNKHVDCTEPKWSLYKMSNTITKNNIINICDFLERKTRSTVFSSSILSNNATTILRNKREITFDCRHCGTRFKTTEWRKTKGGHYSASCPRCPYSVWAK